MLDIGIISAMWYASDMGNPVKTAKQMFDAFLSKHDPTAMPKRPRAPQAQAAASAIASKGGIARASKLTPKKRQQIAKVAANARWKKP